MKWSDVRAKAVREGRLDENRLARLKARLRAAQAAQQARENGPARDQRD